MTTLLQEAFDKASKLPPGTQDLLAREIIEEIEGEARWDETLTHSQPLLEKMAQRALENQRDGKTRQAGFDEL